MKRFRRITACIMTIICAVSIFGCTTSTADSDKIVLIMSDVQEGTHPTALSCDKFAQLVKEKSKGRIVVEVYHGDQLGTEAEQAEQVSVGGIDLARISTNILATYNDDLKALQALYLYSSDEQMWRMLNGEIGNSFLNSETMKRNGITGLTWYSGGSRNFYNNVKEITKPEDLKGLTIRVNTDSMVAFLEKCGATPKNVAYNDIFNSISSGAIQGAENNWPSYISTKHYEVAKYITVDEHTRIPEMIVASTESMSKLSASDQELIHQCAVETTQFQREKMAEYDQKAIKTAEESGCKVTYLTEAQVKAFQDAATAVNEKVSSKYISIINKIKAVQ